MIRLIDYIGTVLEHGKKACDNWPGSEGFVSFMAVMVFLAILIGGLVVASTFGCHIWEKLNREKGSK